jgi:DNA-binding CsgD family transcriptional regulator
MSARVSTHGLWHDFISVNRATELGPHTDGEKQCLQDLLPHLSRASELHRTLTCLQRHYGATLSMLDRLLVGLVLLDRSGRVVVANVAAREICDASGLVKLTSDGRIRASCADDDAILQQLIGAAVQTSTGRGESDGGQVGLSAQSKHVLAEIVPLRDDGLPDRAGIDGAAVFLVDAGLSSVVNLDGITKIFQLSRSESAVAASLANGLSVAQTAEQRNTSPETIRKQLKAVYAKTGANSQLQLLRLALKASPPLRRD